VRGALPVQAERGFCEIGMTIAFCPGKAHDPPHCRQTRLGNSFATCPRILVNGDRKPGERVAPRKETIMARAAEMTPAEQLEALCNARDYYSGLAEILRNRATTADDHAEKWEKQEQKARRFAAAYDRSVKIQRAMIELGYH
jgi:hypothetical protein